MKTFRKATLARMALVPEVVEQEPPRLPRRRVIAAVTALLLVGSVVGVLLFGEDSPPETLKIVASATRYASTEADSRLADFAGSPYGSPENAREVVLLHVKWKLRGEIPDESRLWVMWKPRTDWRWEASFAKPQDVSMGSDPAIDRSGGAWDRFDIDVDPEDNLAAAVDPARGKGEFLVAFST